MRKNALVILVVLIFLLTGCTISINNERDTPGITNGNISGAADDNAPGSPTDTTLQDPTESTPDESAGSPDGSAGSDEALYDGMDKVKIECADSFITDVYSSIIMDEKDNFKEAKYSIIQGKDGTKYTAELRYDSKDYIYYFKVHDESGKNLMSLTTSASYYGDVFEVLDLNMDGYADIKLLTAEGTMNCVYDFFLWDAAAQKFTKAVCDEELLFAEMEAHEDHLQLWGRNSGSSGVITKYKWEGNKLLKISEEEYHADDADAGADTDPDAGADADTGGISGWRFTKDDIKINGKTILGISYEQLLQAFGQPVETKTYKINPPTAGPDYFEYIYVCVYNGFECEIYIGDDEKTPEPADSVFRFDITSPDARLDCELYIGIDTDELDLRYGINKFYRLNEAESYDLNNIKHVLESYKPEGYYSGYEKAAIVYHDFNSFEEPLAKALVLLFDDDTDSVERIVFGYPTAN